MRREEPGLRLHAELTEHHHRPRTHGRPDTLRGAENGTLEVLLVQILVGGIGARCGRSFTRKHILQVGGTQVERLFALLLCQLSVALIALPDVVHRGWTDPEPPLDAPPAPVEEPPERDPAHFWDCEDEDALTGETPESAAPEEEGAPDEAVAPEEVTERTRPGGSALERQDTATNAWTRADRRRG